MIPLPACDVLFPALLVYSTVKYFFIIYLLSVWSKCQPPPETSLQRLAQITFLKESNSNTEGLESDETMPIDGNNMVTDINCSRSKLWLFTASESYSVEYYKGAH